jgi:hypothetical protein
MKNLLEYESYNQGDPEENPFETYLMAAGEYFGYPVCCTKSFTRMRIMGHFPSQTQKVAGQQTGFIPCPQHAQEIVDGKITLQSLVSRGRECQKPFPQECSDEDMERALKAKGVYLPW